MTDETVEYITPEDLVTIVDIIRNLDYPHQEEVPNYDAEQERIDDYFSLIDRLKNDDYYPDLHTKATALLLNLNGHYFSNGNKRLAVFSTVVFLEKNGLKPADWRKEQYAVVLREAFGQQELDDYESFTPTDFAMYNLALITAKANEQCVPFDETKRRVEQFLRATFQY